MWLITTLSSIWHDSKPSNEVTKWESYPGKPVWSKLNNGELGGIRKVGCDVADGDIELVFILGDRLSGDDKLPWGGEIGVPKVKNTA